MRLAPPIAISNPNDERTRCAARLLAVAFNRRRLRTTYKINLPALRSNTHASRRAMWLSGSADLICGHRLDVMRITSAVDAGYLALRRGGVNRSSMAVAGRRQ
jgi:hypothetical protein